MILDLAGSRILDNLPEAGEGGEVTEWSGIVAGEKREEVRQIRFPSARRRWLDARR